MNFIAPWIGLILFLPFWANAQVYSGSNAALSMEVSGGAIAVSTTAVAGRYLEQRQALYLMVQSNTLSLDATEAEKSFLTENLAIEQNPALSFQVDLSELDLAPTPDMKEVQVPVKFRFNGQEHELSGRFVGSLYEERFVVSLAVNVALTAYGIENAPQSPVVFRLKGTLKNMSKRQ